jgi:hypothetical protein
MDVAAAGGAQVSSAMELTAYRSRWLLRRAAGGYLSSRFVCRFILSMSGRHQMSISVANIQPIVALIAGVLILVMPRLLNFIVAIYLILVGIIGLGIIK